MTRSALHGLIEGCLEVFESDIELIRSRLRENDQSPYYDDELANALNQLAKQISAVARSTAEIISSGILR